RTLPGFNGRSRAKRIDARDHKNLRETEVRRFHPHNCRARGAPACVGRFSFAACGSVRPHWKTRASRWTGRPFRGEHAGKCANESLVGRATPCAPPREITERRAEDCPPYLYAYVAQPCCCGGRRAS